MRSGSCWPHRRAARSSTDWSGWAARYNATLLLGTHRIADLGDLAELIGVVFVFGQDSDDAAAAAALRFIGLQPTQELVAEGP